MKLLKKWGKRRGVRNELQMNTKVVWLTSVAVWFWLVPVVRSAELEGEAPELEDAVEEPQIPLSHSLSASDLLPSSPIAEIPVSPQPSITNAEPPDVEPVLPNAETIRIAEPPPESAPQLADAEKLPSPNLSENTQSSSVPSIEDLANDQTLQSPSALKNLGGDPLEDWSTAAWLDLLSEPDDSSAPNLPEPDDITHLSQPQPKVHPPLSSQQAPLTSLPHRAEPSEVALLQTDIEGASSPNQQQIEASQVGKSDPMAQVTSVSQLADVQPTDWAYQALQTLVERYGVIVGYSEGTFRGERALTRYEFAAGVNAAIDRISELIAASSQDTVSEADLAVLTRLQEDFGNELIVLRGRLDGLEARTAEVAANQFSTTVVLSGQTTFALADAWGGEPPGLGETNPVFAYLAQLQLSGSFSERDAFRLDFDAGNFTNGGFADPQALNTQMALMGFQTDTNSSLELSGAEYRFAVGNRLVLTFKPVGFGLNSVLSPNSIFSSSTQGALSRFAAETPIFRIGSLDAGIGLDLLMTDRTRLQIAYGARDASDPEQGLFESDHRALGVQLLARPFRTVTTGLAYVNAFADDGFLDTFTGSTNADTSGGFLEPSAIHALSGTLQWQIAPSVILAAWGGAAVTDSLPSDAVALSTTYQFSLGFPDTFGREGDLLGFMIGQPLRLRYGLLIEREDEASGLHYEVFYRIRVNDNIAITPGVFVVTDPGHIADNNTIVVGAIRTAFSF